MVKYIEMSTDELTALERELSKTTEMYGAIFAAGQELDDEVVETYWEALKWPSVMVGIVCRYSFLH
jgi:hypothetical protein